LGAESQEDEVAIFGEENTLNLKEGEKERLWMTIGAF